MAESEVDSKFLGKFAQKLASNEKKYRDLAIKKLRKWLELRNESGTSLYVVLNRLNC